MILLFQEGEKLKINEELKQLNETAQKQNDESEKKIKSLEEVNNSLKTQADETKKLNSELVCQHKFLIVN